MRKNRLISIIIGLNPTTKHETIVNINSDCRNPDPPLTMLNVFININTGMTRTTILLLLTQISIDNILSDLPRKNASRRPRGNPIPKIKSTTKLGGKVVVVLLDAYIDGYKKYCWEVLP